MYYCICGGELQGGDEVKSCCKCERNYTKNDEGKYVCCDEDFQECVWKE